MPVPCTSMAHKAIISPEQFRGLTNRGLLVLPKDECAVCSNYEQTRLPYEEGSPRQLA